MLGKRQFYGQTGLIDKLSSLHSASQNARLWDNRKSLKNDPFRDKIKANPLVILKIPIVIDGVEVNKQLGFSWLYENIRN